MKKSFIFYFTMSMGNLELLFLDQLVNVGSNVGSRYAQSILEMLVRNLTSVWYLACFIVEKNCSHKYVLPNKAHIFRAYPRRLGNASSEM